MRFNVLIIAAAIGLVVGGVLGWLIKPTYEINEIDVTKYELQNEIQRLEYEAKKSHIETEFLHRMHYVENADSTGLDSLWNNYGF